MKLTVVALVVAAILALIAWLIVHVWRSARRRLEEQAERLASINSRFTAVTGGEARLPSQLTAGALLTEHAAAYGISRDEPLIRLGVLQFLAWLVPAIEHGYEPTIALVTASDALARLYQEERYGPSGATAAEILGACGIEIVPQQRLSAFNVRCASEHMAYRDELKRRGKIPLILVDRATYRRRGISLSHLARKVIVTDDGATLRTTEDPEKAGIEGLQALFS